MEISPLVLALVPLLVGLVEGAKKAGLSHTWAFPLSLLFGIGLSFLVLDSTLTEIVLQGLLLGTSASGLYSGGKKLLE